MPHEFEVRKEITVDATPEQVWEAIATGPGLNAWFMGSANEVEPREGGRVTLAFGDEPIQATVSAWDPPRRFGYRGESEDGSTFMAFEYLIEGRAGGSTWVRFVQSGMLGDDWESEYDALNEGDAMYLHAMAQYVTYFRGRPATYVSTALPQAADRDRALALLRGALGLAGPAHEGDPVRFTPNGLAPIEGVVDYVSPSVLGVRTDDALYRFLHATGNTVFLGHHIYRDDVDQKETEAGWQSWLTGLFG